MKNKKFSVTFDDEISPEILRAFDKTVDKDGYIVESSSGSKVPSKDGSEIKISEFGGLIKGSEIYLKSDIASVIDYVESRS